MNNKELKSIIGTTILLIIIVFFQWKGDMVFRFSSVVLLYYLGGLQYSEKINQRINQIISLIALILVFILGFMFDYFN